LLGSVVLRRWQNAPKETTGNVHGLLSDLIRWSAGDWRAQITVLAVASTFASCGLGADVVQFAYDSTKSGVFGLLLFARLFEQHVCCNVVVTPISRCCFVKGSFMDTRYNYLDHKMKAYKEDLGYGGWPLGAGCSVR
jgi:hypothetical protein